MRAFKAFWIAGLCAVFLLPALGLAQISTAETGSPVFEFLTEDSPPLNFLDNGVPAGQAVELVRALMAETGTAGEIQLLPWSDAMERVQAGGARVLFSTALTPERQQQFQWVGPTAVLHTGLYALADRDVEINTLQQARAADSIASVIDYYSDQLLLADGGFDNLVRFPDELSAIRALLAGEVELMVADNATLPAQLARLGADIADVRRVFEISTDLIYLAFSRDVPAATIERWQAALDTLKADGRFTEIYRRWLPVETPPGRMYLVTEEYPPITFMQEGRPGGFVTECVRQIAADLGLEDHVQLTSWSNAYSMALLHPNVVLFSAERTPEREDRFHWVGPVGRNSAILYARAGSGLTLDSLDQARDLPAIATTTDWFTEQDLKARGFDNLLSSPDPADSVRSLMSGQASLAIFTDLTVSEIVERTGYSMSDLEPIMVVSQTDFYIALSRNTAPERVAQWRAALETVKRDGRFERIYRASLPDVNLDGLMD